ncbi:MAG: hypothetical protein QOI46_6000, partial [Alphaproteobacteria bacterium]|nr:hypothetical protein [Alphaproteobacteria bacterium]
MRCWATWPPDCPEHRSLCRTYEIDPASLSNSYAPIGTLAARVDAASAESADETTTIRGYPARPKNNGRHDDRSHFPSDPICRDGRIPVSGHAHARCARLRCLCQSQDARRCAAVAAAQSSARARSPSPADPHEKQNVGEGRTYRALTMSVLHMGRGHGEGRARLQDVVADGHARPSFPRSTR